MGSCNGILGKNSELTNRSLGESKSMMAAEELRYQEDLKNTCDFTDLPEESSRVSLEYPKGGPAIALEKINNLANDKSKEQIENLIKLYYQGQVESSIIEEARQLGCEKEDQTTGGSSNNELYLIKISIQSNQSKSDANMQATPNRGEFQVMTNRSEMEHFKKDFTNNKDQVYKDYIELISKRTNDMADRLDKQKSEFEKIKESLGKTSEKSESSKHNHRTKKFEENYKTYLEKKFSQSAFQRHNSPERETCSQAHSRDRDRDRDLSGSINSRKRGCLRNSYHDIYVQKGPPKKVHFKKQWETQY